ncbi:Stk1 family PASTA domain-containing Ser/Thr kinase [Nonomuraea phyllanthi]|uniref:non-specific serine/threonine protein kinase n=1 Tax=Nonomuraea phyllanthi TaxID=2219224 RepID=A0A5C4WSW5_9ACTN|nr:Stk1 family PASTA domain-containing Ser/Thr kinase [Nonomuraea phyllanthi]KAB8196295.1 Stk1 family PASTA domain-containing Ser/Thr kinase [Nonomuraea phyllanthi]QFY05408.1 Stk1 family PASTA domain-containing Ser/Thr kinase [Nonomuraea phyllanthi]
MTQPRLLGGRYELDGVVGRGGMAEVYRARDIRLDRIVAIKTLRSDLARDHTFQARFRREAQSAASLNHPAVVAVYDTGEDATDGTPVPYIVMEYVDGRTLRDLLRQDRRLLPERAVELVDGILRALDYSHRGGIVHRDIKPANVMITRAGDVKVMDFGIARAMADSAATMTQTAQVIGTAQYLSPEQARGERVDARSDIYSTGCLLYELLTGQPPFTGDSPVAIAYQHVREEPIPPSQIDRDIPAWADAIVLKAMAKDPAHRYQSAGEMRADIQRAMSGMPVDAQTMAMTGNYGQGTRMMTATQAGHGPATQRTTAVPPYEYDEGGGGGRGSRRRASGGGGGKAVKTALWIIVPLLIIGAFITVGYVVFASKDAPSDTQISIPSLASQEAKYAQQQLVTLGLKVDVVQDFSDDVDKGSVIKTEPPASTKVEKGSSVKLFVSKGPEKVKVPDGLIGATQADAMSQLEAAGLRGTVKTKVSSKEQGTVIDTRPKAGEELEKGGTVTLYVPKELSEVPAVIDLTVEDATKRLKAAGFKVKVVPQPSDVPEGTVIQQNPGEGAKQQPGTTITLVVSSGPETGGTDQPPFTDEPSDEPTDLPTDDGSGDFPNQDEPPPDNPIGDEGLGGN